MGNLLYSVSNGLIRAQLRLWSHWRVQGRENVPRTGPLLVVANHLSNMDGPLMGASIPRRLFFIVKRGVFKPVIATFLRRYGAYPMDYDGRDVEPFFWARQLLLQGDAVMFFPEAQRNPGGMQRAHPGVALLAVRLGVPIVPVGITGTGHIGPPWRVLFPTGRITVRIGEPFTLPQAQGKLPRRELQALVDQVMHRVADLLPEQYQGVYRSKLAQQPVATHTPQGSAPQDTQGLRAP